MPHKSFNTLNAKRAKAEARVLAKANALYAKAVKLERDGKPLQARAEVVKARALVKRAYSSKFLDAPIGRLPNGMFDAAAKAKAKPVERIRPIVDKQTGERGEIIGGAPGGFLKVKWHSRAKPTLIKRSEVKLRRGLRYNGIVEAAAGLQALEYIGAKAKKSGLGKAPKFNPAAQYGDLVLIRVEHARPSGKGWAVYDKWENRNGLPETKLSEAVALADKLHSRFKYQTRVYVKRQGKAGSTIYRNPTRKGSRDALGVWHAEATANPKPKRHNPSVAEVSRMFQGKANGKVAELNAPDSAPADLARIGRFVFLKLANGAPLRIPRAMVATDTKGKLWIVGKGPLLTKKAKPGERLDYGEISAICYDTAKAHIGNGKRYEYVHQFGEDGGKRPRLQVDHEGMPLISGGDYKIEARGIVN